MYPEMAATAREEGFTRLAYLFEAVAAIEKEHEERYLKPVSYTHLDVYKRQVSAGAGC